MNAPEFTYLEDVTCKADEKYAVASKAVAEFERWTGKMLGGAHRRVIATLEWLRSQTEQPRRVWVHDDGKCGEMVKELLVDYVRWLDEMVNEMGQSRRVSHTLVMARGLRAAREICGRAPAGHFIPSTIRSPLSAYGQRFLNALVLEADRCPDTAHGTRYMEMRRVIMPAAPEVGMVIVHGNARRWSTLFSAEFRRMAAADCPITVIAANPVKERRRGWNRKGERRPGKEEAALISEVTSLKRRLGEVVGPAACLSAPERLARDLLRESVRIAEKKLDDWRKLYLPFILERAERRRVLEVIYEIAPHIARDPKVRQRKGACSGEGAGGDALDAGDRVERRLKRMRKVSSLCDEPALSGASELEGSILPAATG